MAAAMDLSDWEADPRLFLFTSLTAGSSHIITATSRLETILKANRIPFQAIDTATEEKARRLWGRRAGKRKLPGLVKEGYVVGDLEEVEEWNEFGELKENIGPVPSKESAPTGMPGSTQPPAESATSTTPSATAKSSEAQSSAQTDLPTRDAASQAASIGLARQDKPPVLVDSSKIKPLSDKSEPLAPATTSAAETKEDAPVPAKEEAIDAPPKPETMNSAAAEKKESIKTAEATSSSRSESEKAGEAVDDPAPAIPGSTGEETEKHSSGESSQEPVEREVDQASTGAEEDTEDASKKVEAVEGVQSTNTAEKKTQEQDAGEADKAGVSVED